MADSKLIVGVVMTSTGSIKYHDISLSKACKIVGANTRKTADKMRGRLLKKVEVGKYTLVLIRNDVHKPLEGFQKAAVVALFQPGTVYKVKGDEEEITRELRCVRKYPDFILFEQDAVMGTYTECHSYFNLAQMVICKAS